MKKEIKMFDAKQAYIPLLNSFESAVTTAMRAGDYIGGSEVKKFEADFAKFLDVKHVIGCANGTDAIQIALMSLKLPLGSEILLPAYNYIAGAEVVSMLGFKPKFVDVDGSFNMSFESLKEKVTENTKAVIVTHLFGCPADISKISKFCKIRKIFLIEDNAQSVGAKFGGQSLGTFGDIGTTSFYPTKVLGCFGDGGAVYTNNKKLAEDIRMIANHGQKAKYKSVMIGCNSRLDNIQAAILNVKLKYLKPEIQHRIDIAMEYIRNMDINIDLQVEPMSTQIIDRIYSQFVIVAPTAKTRDSLRYWLEKNGVQTDIYYPFFYGDASLTNAKILSERSIALPIHGTMSVDDATYICDVISKFFEKERAI